MLTAPIESAAISPATTIGLLVFMALLLSIETFASIGSLQMSSIRMRTDNSGSMKKLGASAESQMGVILDYWTRSMNSQGYRLIERAKEL